ncbi:MAG TPA: dihydrofolate reductase family protein [Planctomycetota bacterium]|nr:dihydrofolate reductase family protein [Planctomycetota bacterium]
MRKIIAITQLSLDGVMQSPGGPEEDPRNGFNLGGWAMSFGDAVLHRVLNETIAGKFDLLLGRRTYEIWAGYWPKNGDNPIGQAFNRATKYVVTRRRKRLDWEKSQRIDGDVVKQVRQLKAARGPALHVWGSGKLLQTLMAANLVDEHRLWIVPMVLGKGDRLFEHGLTPHRLTLAKTESTSTGVLINTYRAAAPKKRSKTAG